jgi:hypothetical protein
MELLSSIKNIGRKIVPSLFGHTEKEGVKFYAVPSFWVFCVAALSFLMSSILGALTNSLFGVAVFFATFGSFLFQGLRRIPANPPHKAALTLFGKRTGGWKNEGWKFFPFFPYVFGYIKIPSGRQTTEIKTKVRTPDRAESELPVTITWEPLETHFIQYLNSGDFKGVEDQLSAKTHERVRQWAMGNEEGPETWADLYMMQFEAVGVIMKRLAPNSLKEIPEFAQDVPTSVWLRFFRQPRPRKALPHEKPWIGGKLDWAPLEEKFKGFPADKQNELREATKERRKQLIELESGSANILDLSLGIRIIRLNVTEPEVLGEVAKAAEREAKESQEKRAETLELRHLAARVKELVGRFNLSPEQALEVVQTERGKVKKDIAETKLNISPETRGMIEKILPTLIDSVFSRKGGNA